MSKAFLFICTILAIFISVSGLVTSPSPVHFVFLPVPLYLIATSVAQLRSSRAQPEVFLTSRRSGLIVALFFLGFLLAYKLTGIFMP